MNSTFWMIAKKDASRYLYWTGTLGHKTITTSEPWTEKVPEAVHFARQRDAQAVIAGVIDWSGAEVIMVAGAQKI